MKFYLVYFFGACTDCSCCNDMKEYDTLAEALAEGERLMRRQREDGGYTVIHGAKVGGRDGDEGS